MSRPDPFLREMRASEALEFAAWEKTRPYPWTADHFRETLRSKTSRTLVWESGEPGKEAATGFAVLQIVDGEGYILNIMLAPKLRGKGKSGEFFRCVEAWARKNGARSLLLDVEPNNIPALKLYEKMGFRALARRAAAYPQGEDSIVMRKDL